MTTSIDTRLLTNDYWYIDPEEDHFDPSNSPSISKFFDSPSNIDTPTPSLLPSIPFTATRRFLTYEQIPITENPEEIQERQQTGLQERTSGVFESTLLPFAPSYYDYDQFRNKKSEAIPLTPSYETPFDTQFQRNPAIEENSGVNTLTNVVKHPLSGIYTCGSLFDNFKLFFIDIGKVLTISRIAVAIIGKITAWGGLFLSLINLIKTTKEVDEAYDFSKNSIISLEAKKHLFRTLSTEDPNYNSRTLSNIEKIFTKIQKFEDRYLNDKNGNPSEIKIKQLENRIRPWAKDEVLNIIETLHALRNSYYTENGNLPDINKQIMQETKKLITLLKVQNKKDKIFRTNSLALTLASVMAFLVILTSLYIKRYKHLAPLYNILLYSGNTILVTTYVLEFINYIAKRGIQDQRKGIPIEGNEDQKKSFSFIQGFVKPTEDIKDSIVNKTISIRDFARRIFRIKNQEIDEAPIDEVDEAPLISEGL